MELKGKSTRPGLYKCGDCREQFTVTVNTVFERSHVPINKLVLATHLMCASKKGVSAHQLHRTLGVTYKAAWFIANRIREAMRPSDTIKMGGNGGFVEVDETYLCNKTIRLGKRRSAYEKEKVITLVERDGAAVRWISKQQQLDLIRTILKDKYGENSDEYTKMKQCLDDTKTALDNRHEYVHSVYYLSDGFRIKPKRGKFTTSKLDINLNKMSVGLSKPQTL
jgi:hypothetical protein